MSNQTINRIKIPAILMVVSGTVFYLTGYYSFSVGKIINKFYPCTQNPMNSFPCFGIYDFWLMGAMAGIFILALLTAIIKIILFLRANKKL